MNIRELKDAIHDIVTRYFPDTPVIWAEQKRAVKQNRSFILLKLNDAPRPIHFIKETQNNAPVGYISLKSILEVQLFTKGEQRTVEDGEGNEYPVTVNTALEDMIDFDLYMASDYVRELCNRYDIDILPETPPRDISEVVDTEWEYRAMMELSVSFTQTTKGKAGISRENWSPTPSGGGTEELANMQTEVMDSSDVQITEN